LQLGSKDVYGALKCLNKRRHLNLCRMPECARSALPAVFCQHLLVFVHCSQHNSLFQRQEQSSNVGHHAIGGNLPNKMVRQNLSVPAGGMQQPGEDFCLRSFPRADLHPPEAAA
jgi:hypothetical protein